MAEALSKKSLKRLGSRLRAATVTESSDLDLLDGYRRRFDHALVDINTQLAGDFKSKNVEALVSGRIKRTKSIVRKLVREPTMDLSRMTDIAGLRVVVRDLEKQNSLIERISNHIESPRIVDRRTREDLYRSIHITGNCDGLPIEVQLRSIPQQLWANESESFGEKVKEGGGNREEKEYLSELSKAIYDYENDQSATFGEIQSTLAQARRPFDYRLEWLVQNFDTAIGEIQSDEVKSTLLNYDSRTGEIIKSLSFGVGERSEAVAEFEHLSRTLDPVRYDVLILNSTSHSGLCVTHPRFYL